MTLRTALDGSSAPRRNRSHAAMTCFSSSGCGKPETVSSDSMWPPLLFGGLADDHPPRRISGLTPRTESARVALDSLLSSNPCFAGVEPRRPPSPSLAEQVPALVQRDLEPSEPITVGVGHLPVRLTLEQLVFLARKFVDSAEDLRVVHGASFSSASVPIGSCKLEKRRQWHPHRSSDRHVLQYRSDRGLRVYAEGVDDRPVPSVGALDRVHDRHVIRIRGAFEPTVSADHQVARVQRLVRVDDPQTSSNDREARDESHAYEFLDRFSERGGLNPDHGAHPEKERRVWAEGRPSVWRRWGGTRSRGPGHRGRQAARRASGPLWSKWLALPSRPSRRRQRRRLRIWHGHADDEGDQSLHRPAISFRVCNGR